ncbi:MAG TPA: P-loop NTPase [Anaeromyxobacteraceae bacterium]|nr:P-loop NTPase [Anaeromyxobacteraceae bacterium]
MSGALRIVVASGKGGTGKTTIATNLAAILAETGTRTAYVDCDVEEPNGHLFLRPSIHATREISTPVPEIDEARCTLCGACGKACRYSAILALPNKVLTFPKLCHGCGGCTLPCSASAIREVPRPTDVVEEGTAGQVVFLHGRLNVGEAMAPSVIRAVLEAAPIEGTIVIDAPPGTSCPVIASVKAAEVVLLVTEPTPFGLNDLKLAVEMVRELGVPFGVVVNRAGTGDRTVFEYCAAEDIPVLLELPNDRKIAQAYSRGQLCAGVMPELQPRFLELCAKLRDLARMHRTERPTKPVVFFAQAAAQERLPSETVQLGRKRELDEIVVVSGKGGTGKTSIVAKFVALAEHAAMADCDVDAPDLHLVLGPTVRQRRPFSGGSRAVIHPAACTGCGECLRRCRFGAIRQPPPGDGVAFRIDAVSCEGCGVCVDICPAHATALVPTTNGEWLVSDTRHGSMVHAHLGIAQENSGKLVSLVRREAKAVAAAAQSALLICDGSPGIGCPVIASLSGARIVLVVTEPTVSGLHDLRRVAELCQQLKVNAAVCINKADINPEVAAEIEAEAAHRSMPVLGTIRYDDSVTAARVRRVAVVEHGAGPAATDIRALWARVQAAMGGA